MPSFFSAFAQDALVPTQWCPTLLGARRRRRLLVQRTEPPIHAKYAEEGDRFCWYVIAQLVARSTQFCLLPHGADSHRPRPPQKISSPRLARKGTPRWPTRKPPGCVCLLDLMNAALVAAMLPLSQLKPHCHHLCSSLTRRRMVLIGSMMSSCSQMAGTRSCRRTPPDERT